MINQMWLTLLKIQMNIDELRRDLDKLESDEITSSMMCTIVGHRVHTLSETAELTSQLLEGFSRKFRELKDVENKEKGGDNVCIHKNVK